MCGITQSDLLNIENYYNLDEGVKDICGDLYFSGEDKELIRLCEQLKWARIHLKTYLEYLVVED